MWILWDDAGYIRAVQIMQVVMKLERGYHELTHRQAMLTTRGGGPGAENGWRGTTTKLPLIGFRARAIHHLAPVDSSFSAFSVAWKQDSLRSKGQPAVRVLSFQ